MNPTPRQLRRFSTVLRYGTALLLPGLLAAALFAGAGALNIRLLHLRGDLHLTQAPPVENLPPSVAFTTIALGGFRGLLADVLWMRAGALQEEGRYFELVQLSDWISRLQPRSPAIWAYHAWNLAYNLSVRMPSPAERWRWVRNGLFLLRDDGMRHNPGSARLHQELAWMFIHKLGSDDDSAAPFYRARWAADESAAATAALDPAAVAAITRDIAPLDWSTPQAHAVYWAFTGLPFARNPADDLALRRTLYQALLQLTFNGHPELLPSLIRCVEETQARHPDIAALSDLLRDLRTREKSAPAAPSALRRLP